MSHTNERAGRAMSSAYLLAVLIAVLYCFYQFSHAADRAMTARTGAVSEWERLSELPRGK